MPQTFLYKKDYRINDDISVRIPLLRDVLDQEEKYYQNIATVIATPYDMMVQLDDSGVDFTTINDWDLFCMLFNDFKNGDLSLIFGDLDLSKFRHTADLRSGTIVLRDPATGITIDRAIHGQICAFLRKLLRIEKKEMYPANEEAKSYMIKRARQKQQRNKSRGKGRVSQLENYIVSLVNTSEFPYDYESVLDLTIYQFYASVQQVTNKIRFDKLMIGCYAGTVNTKEINPKELNWISNEI